MATLTFDEAEIFSIMAEAKVPKAHAAAMVKALHKVQVDTGELATKHDIELVRRDIELSEERQTRKSAQQQILTIAILTGVMGVMLVMQGYFLMTLLPSAP